ncbi:hypothetical protein MFLAVUS_011076, partial [Mucor flavus]
MNYSSRVKRDFFDNEERTVKKLRNSLNANETKKSSADSSDSEASSTTLRNIWTIWTDFLSMFFQEEVDGLDINHYSLEYLGIVQVGENIGSNQSRATYPKELVQATNKLLKESKQDVFLRFNSNYKEWFDSLNDDIDKCHTLLLRNALRVKVTKDPTLTFCYEFFILYDILRVLILFFSPSVTQVYTSPEITEQESTYNHKVIWRFMDTVKMVTPYCKFIPGETRLQAIKFELERRGLSPSHYYNADGILLDKSCDMELALLETTGPFGLKDITRETTDHVKAAYGLLAMLHK